MTTQTTDITPEFFLFFRDVTSCYETAEGRKLVERCGGKIYDVYIFDNNRHVNCAELRPSFEMNYVESIPGGIVTFPNSKADDENSPYETDIDEDLREANNDTESVMYIHTFDIEDCGNLRIEKNDEIERAEWLELLEDNGGDREAAHREAVGRIREQCYANPTY